MSLKCRVWWPKELSIEQQPQCSNLVLFGWFISRSIDSLDIVVAFAYDQSFLSLHSRDSSSLLVATNLAHEAMPVRLKDESNMRVLGCCALPSEDFCDLCEPSMADGDLKQPFGYRNACLGNHCSNSSVNSKSLSSGFPEHGGLLQQYKSAFSDGSSWIQLVLVAKNCPSSAVCWVPTLHHLHWNGKMLSSAELHVIVYETPRYGSHHFSISSSGSNCIQCSPKRPKWIDELSNKPRILDLDMVIVAINSSAGAKVCFGRNFGIPRYTLSSIIPMCLNFLWMLFSAIVAAVSTFLYVVLQSFYKLAGNGSNYIICGALAAVFNNTLINIRFRSQQILYWPFFLIEIGPRSQACVEYAEIGGLRRHSLWSSTVVDVALGNLLGFTLLFNVDFVFRLISNFAVQFADDVLRTGCVWLMGVPAGFKLNTELAGVLGTVSFNAIQIWCSLWIMAADIFFNFIKVVALLGIFLGMTVSAALITDMIAVASFHISTLHHFVAFFYSLQIEALTSLWRLFRGRKWNPLRQRLDSYEYSVEQHVVGSLLFTPLLLLLPTTSVFYIFFATVNLAMILLRIGIQIMISVIHYTPYTKILLWLVSSKRFPSGIWFDIVHSRSASSAVSLQANAWLSIETMLPDQEKHACEPSVLLSFVRSNILTFGQVVLPHYKKMLSGVHGPTLASAVSGILTGKSISMTQNSQLPQQLPWFSISYKDYWCICYQAILTCLQP